MIKEDLTRMNNNSVSVEEAAALLGAAINRLHQATGQTFRTVPPPPGLPSIFSIVNPIPCRELYDRLVSLRAILRSIAGMKEEDERKTHSWSLSGRGDAMRSFVVNIPPSYPSLAAAPSILQLLLKLLSISSSLAQTPVLIHSNTSSISNNNGGSVSKSFTALPIRITPPLSSQILRALWVDCVLLCHRLSPLSSPTSFDARNSQTSLNNMSVSQSASGKILAIYLEYASANPKAAKALGGTRVASLLVLHALFSDLCLGPRLVAHTEGVLSVCHRALKSSGAHDALYRIEAVRCTIAIASAIRLTYLTRSKTTHGGSTLFWCARAMDDSTILEIVKILKRVAEDPVPDVRIAGAELACMVSSMLIHQIDLNGNGNYVCSRPDLVGNNPLSSMDDIMLLASKNIDDESPAVAIVWAESLARCICAVLEFYDRNIEIDSSQKRRNRDNNEIERSPAKRSQSGLGMNQTTDFASKFRSLSDVRGTKSTSFGITSSMCTSLSLALSTLGNTFTKIGGETTATKLGGLYSVGGRSVRIGIGTTMMFLVQFQSVSGAIGPNTSINTSEVLSIILNMVGTDLEIAAVQVPEKLFTLGSSEMGKGLSTNDIGLCTFCVYRIIRRGLSEVSSEGIQVYLLRELSQICLSSKGSCNGENGSTTYLQLQLALIEISNLLSVLGEAAVSVFDELIPALEWCLSSPDKAVRHEAALSYQALTYTFPSVGRKFILTACDELQMHIDEIVSYVLMKKELKGLGRSDDSDTLETAHRIFSLRGYSLALSLVLHELPNKPGALSSDSIANLANLAFTLIQCQYDKVLVTVFAVGACECSVAGWIIICALLSLGPAAVTMFSERLFNSWAQHAKPLPSSTLKLPVLHELKCLEAKVKSAIVFLKYCSHLLLTQNGALSSAVSFAENCISYLRDDGILATIKDEGSDQYLLDSIRSSLLELFCWLPPGTYPMLTDELFTFATSFLIKLSLLDISCSILPSLLNIEDDLIHGACLTRCDRLEHTGGALYLDENISSLRSSYLHISEREAITPFILWKEKRITATSSVDELHDSMPTPLHQVGNWRRPPLQSPSSRVRLLDASIHLFSVLFGMRNGLEQDGDVRFLEDLLTSSVQNIKLLAVGTEKNRLCDSETIQKNVAATILSCLHSLPTAEVSGDNMQTAGPPWMKRSAGLLLKLLSSPFQVVHRAGVEGLALLSSLGIIEDAYLVQSSIIHSLGSLLDIGMNNSGAASVRKSVSESVDQSRSSAILTIGCIQRTAWTRANKRIHPESVANRKKMIGESVIIMLTRILQASAGNTVDSDILSVRTYFLQAWSTLLLYSDAFDEGMHSLDLQTHLLLKSIELIENNFFAGWTMVMCDETEKVDNVGADVAFLAVLIRLIRSVATRIYILNYDARRKTLERLVTMVHGIADVSMHHSVILQEAMRFMVDICHTDWSLITDLSPIIYQLVSPLRPQVLTMQGVSNLPYFSRSPASENLSLQILNIIATLGQEKQIPLMYSFTILDKFWGTQEFPHTIDRFMLLPRSRANVFYDIHAELSTAIETLVSSQRRVKHCLADILTYSIRLVSGEITDSENSLSRPIRWQVKSEAIKLLIMLLVCSFKEKTDDSFLTGQFEDVITISCTSSMSTSGQSELFFLQGLSLQLLTVALRRLETQSPVIVMNDHAMENRWNQIFPCIKHSINSLTSSAHDSITSEGLTVLFRSGCECLPILCDLGMISDPTVFKRLVHTLIDTETAIVPESRSNTSFVGDRLGLNTPKVLASKVATISQVYMESKVNIIGETFSLCIESEPLSRLRDFAFISAALAIDNYYHGQAITTREIEKSSMQSGGSVLMPYISSFSISLLLYILHRSNESDNVDVDKRMIISWLDPLITIAIAELYQGISPFDPVLSKRFRESRNQQRICATIYRALKEVVRSELLLHRPGVSLRPLISLTFDGIINPYFERISEENASADMMADNYSVNAIEACDFILSICQSQIVSGLEVKQLMSFLIPILGTKKENALQPLNIDRFGPFSSIKVKNHIVAAVQHLLSINSGLFDEVSITVILTFCIDELSTSYNRGDLMGSVNESALLSLLRSSFTNEVMSDDRQRCIIHQSAKNKQWRIWLIACKHLRNPAIILDSLSYLWANLSSYDDINDVQLIISAVVQLIADRAEYIPFFNLYIGQYLVDTLLKFGICRDGLYESRLVICSNIIEFLKLSFQFMDHALESNNEESVLFLAFLLECMVGMIQFNGLPDDSPRVNIHADPSLGRLCAQTLVSLARYSPSKLKQSMMHLSIDQTLVVESAMRADIAGYAKTASSTLKKKIDLKGYVS